MYKAILAALGLAAAATGAYAQQVPFQARATHFENLCREANIEQTAQRNVEAHHAKPFPTGSLCDCMGKLAAASTTGDAITKEVQDKLMVYCYRKVTDQL
jgi:hypothetical protein